MTPRKRLGSPRLLVVVEIALETEALDPDVRGSIIAGPTFLTTTINYQTYFVGVGDGEQHGDPGRPESADLSTRMLFPKLIDIKGQ